MRDQRKGKSTGGEPFAFETPFDSFFAIRRRQLSNGKHVQQWLNTMRDYVFPVIGDRPVADISAGDVIDVLKPIWFTKGQQGPAAV
jgi:hypothetical protein